MLFRSQASAGLAVHPADGATPALLVQRADIAMYVAKSRHQRVVRYASHLDEHSPRKLALLSALRRSVVDDQLVIVSPDRPGLFSRVAGVLSLNGLTVL